MEPKAVLEIPSLKLSTHDIPIFGICMEKSKVASLLIMNQGKVTNQLPKLRYTFLSENIGLPKERELNGNGVSVVPNATPVIGVTQVDCNVCR